MLASLWETNTYETQSVKMRSHGDCVGIPELYSNATLGFQVGRPGTLSGAWMDSPNEDPYHPGPTTVELYPSSQCMTGADAVCGGSPIWTSARNISEGSVSEHLGPGGYTLLWLNSQSDPTPVVVFTQDLVFTPSAWWWL